MACKACGEEPQKCNCQHKDSCMSPAVLEIVNEPEIVTFCKVVIPASAGDEKTNPPLPGLYRNVLLEYEASGEAYLYSSDGIPTKLTDKAELKRLETLIGNEVADRYNADVNLQNQINEIDVSGLEEAIRQEVKAREDGDRILEATLEDRIAHNERETIRVEDKVNTNHEAIVDLQENKADKSDIPEPYELPVATASSLGGIKVGDNLIIDEDGTLSATGGGSTENFPNATIIGSPAINEGQVSNLDEYNYLQFPFVLDTTGKTFQIDFCFTTGYEVGTQQNIIDSKFGIALAIQGSLGVMSISSNGSSWDVGTRSGHFIFEPNTTYYARLSWDGRYYKTSVSTDGTTFTEDISIRGTTRPFPTTHYIGGVEGEIVGHDAHPFLGTINLNKCSMSINGELFWKGMDNLGLLTRADISLSNIDTAGEQRIKDLAGGGGNADFTPTNPIVIGKYGGKDLFRIAIPIENRTFAASDTIPSGEAGQIIGYISNFTEDSMVVRTYGSISKSSPYAYPRQSRGGVAVPFVEFTEGNSARIWVGKSDEQYMPAPVILTVTGSSLYGWYGDCVVVEYTI